ncbi:NETI motif-containing protein [Metabacillus sp. HB246100]|uniref:NETI motif-containing protein n=1 Tax=Bacillus weihaiensis TaxID=1547283 RepID=UPI0023520359|nr:NETI motif-containing protein [Bacillus weihaiensis]
MTNKPSKKKFTVEENETIDDCLARMSKEGYFPVRRTEQPIFKEELNGKQVEPVPCGRVIVFEGKLL